MPIDANVTKNLTVFTRVGIDRDDVENVFTVSAGVGANINFVPESNEAAHATYTISPTMISETGFSHGTQRYGFRHPAGDTPYYRTTALNPPTLFPIPTKGTTYGGNELPATVPLYEPFLPAETYGGGLTVGQTSYDPGCGGQGGLIPYNNRGYSNAGNEDITKSYKNHTFKFGVLIQQDHKSEPIGGVTYMGAYNFGSTTSNPLDSGNGYANALLGNYQTYQQAAKFHILLDAVRCPRRDGELFARQLRNFNYYLAKGLYAIYYNDFSPLWECGKPAACAGFPRTGERVGSLLLACQAFLADLQYSTTTIRI